MMRSRLSVFAAIVAAVVLASPPLAGADGSGPHNQLMVVNQTDGQALTRGRAVFNVDQGPTVAPENAALARASCTDCRTVAVAIQVVAMEGSISDFRPLNAAVALNEQCTRCQTYAYARQEVLTVDGTLDLSDAGRDALRRLGEQVRRVADSDEPFLSMGADLDGLTLQMVDVVRGEIDRSGGRETGRSAQRDADQRG